MQKNEMVIKRKVLIDGIEQPGLVECSGIKSDEGVVDVPSFGRKTPLGDGVLRLEPVAVKYAIRRGTTTLDVIQNWHLNKEYHDVIVIATDASGVEFSKWLLRDCEFIGYSEEKYDAAAPTYATVSGTISCTTEPVP